MKIKERYAGGMSQQPLFVVYCESKLNQVTFVQYVRAADATSAMRAVEGPGVLPKHAEVMAEGETQLLDALNRTQLGLAAANDAIRDLRRNRILARPVWTVMLGVLLALAIWYVLSLIVSLAVFLVSDRETPRMMPAGSISSPR